MESCFDFLGKKCFHRLSLFGIFVFTFFGTIIFSVLLYHEVTESEKFRCYKADKKTSDIIRDGCYDDYNKQFNRNFPLYGFTFLVLSLALGVCVVYSQYVRSQVEHEINPTENSPVIRCTVFRAYSAHLVIKSIVMIVGLVLQWGLIYPMSFPVKFSCRSGRTKNNSTETPSNNASTTIISDYHCKNPPARTKTIFAIALFATAALSLGLSLAELICLHSKAKNATFTNNENFCRNYLNNINSTVEEQVVPDAQTLLNMENNQASFTQSTQAALVLETTLITEEEQVVDGVQATPLLLDNQASLTQRTQAFQDGLCQRIENRTKEIRSPIPTKLSDLSNGVSKKRNLDEVFVNVSIQHGIAKQNFRKIDERRKILDSYYPDKSIDTCNTFDKPTEIFGPSKNPQDTSDSPRIVLAVGRPGIGKSCLARKLVREWAKSKQATTPAEQIEEPENTNENGERIEKAEEFTRRINFVFAFEFRRLNQWPSVSLKELLKRSLYSENLDDDEVLRDILSRPSEILFVFDGLDEAKNIDEDIKKEKDGVFDQNNEKLPIGALFAKLVLGKLLSGATILTTTRSSALTDAMIDLFYDNVNEKDRRVVEILGFSTDKVKEFIDKFASENIRGQIWAHIEQNGNLLSLCYIPVNCFIVCYTLIDKIMQNLREAPNTPLHPTPSTLPNTLTEIYEIALNRFVLNHHAFYKEIKAIRRREYDNFQFCKCVNETLQKLGKIAKKGLEEEKLIFSKTDITCGSNAEEERISDETLDGLVKSGLLYTLPNLEGLYEEEYCFVHLTFQEFLAARVIADGEIEEIKVLTKSVMKEGSKMKLVHRFVAGLLKRSDNPAQHIDYLLKPLLSFICRHSSVINDAVLLLVHCLFEFNDEDKSKQVVSGLNTTKVVLVAMKLTDADCGALVFFCKHLKRGNLNIKQNYIGPRGCAQLVQLVKDGNIIDLDISFNHIGDEGARHLAKAMENANCQLKRLMIERNNLTDDGVKYLTNVIAKPICQLDIFHLSITGLTAIGIKYLTEVLKSKLTGIRLAHGVLNDDQMKDFKEALIMPTSKLTELDLERNKITSLGAKYLKEAMESKHCHLKLLKLKRNPLGDNGVKYICEALLNDNCKLQGLFVDKVGLTCDGGMHLAQALKTSQCTLRTLLVNENQLTHIGLKYLIEALNSNNQCKLTHLSMTMNCVTRDEKMQLAQILKSSTCQLKDFNGKEFDVNQIFKQLCKRDTVRLNVQTNVSRICLVMLI